MSTMESMYDEITILLFFTMCAGDFKKDLFSLINLSVVEL